MKARKLLSIILALAMIIGTISTTVMADENVVEVSAAIAITSDTTYTGTKFVRATGYTGSFFEISGDAKLTLTDCTVDAGASWSVEDGKLDGAIATIEAGGKISDNVNEFITLGTENVATTASLIVVNDGALELDGTIVENMYAANGGISAINSKGGNEIIINDTTLRNIAVNGQASVMNATSGNDNVTISGETNITNNIGTDPGALIYVAGGTGLFTINNANVYDNIGLDGSIISSRYNTFVINDCNIYNNHCLYTGHNNNLSPVYANTNTDFTMNDGEISGNYGYFSNAIVVTANSNIQLNGGTIGNGIESNCVAGSLIANNSVNIGEDMTVEGSVWAHTNAAIENNGTVNGNVETRSSFENNGTITGTVYSSAPVINNETGVIGGDVYAINSAEFINKGEFNGSIKNENNEVVVARTNGKNFASLADAIDAAEADYASNPNPVVTLVDDVTIVGGYYNNIGNNGAISSLTIDLNGFNLHLNSDIKVFTDIEVINGTITAEFGGTGGFYMFADANGKTYDAAFENVDINLSNAGGFAFLSPNGGDPDATFTFDNCDVNVSDFGGGVSFVNAQGGIKVVINETTIYSDNCGRVFVNADVDMDNSTIIATNVKEHAFRNLSGTITNSTIDVKGSENGIKNDNGKALVVNGNSKVTLTGATGYDLLLDKASTVSAEDDAVVYADKASISDDSSVSGKVINKANTVYVQFKKTDVNASGDTLEGADKYEIILAGFNNDKINELASADLTFEFIPTAISGGALNYDVEGAKGVSVTPIGNRYMFNYNGVDKYEETGAAIVIGTITVEGYGSYSLRVNENVTTNAVYATEIRDSIVDEFDPAADLKLNEDMDTTDDMVGEIDSAIIEVPTRALEVEIDFNNAVNKQVADYQDMTVIVSGGDLPANIEIELGKENYTEDVEISGKSNAEYSVVADADNKYTVNVTGALSVNRTYTVTVKGAGYRTVRKNITMAEDKTVANKLNFWNNVKDVEGADYLAGDIVKDNVINVYDLSAVVSYFGTINNVTIESTYAKYDLNRDGKVDSKDVAYVLVSWGK